MVHHSCPSDFRRGNFLLAHSERQLKLGSSTNSVLTSLFTSFFSNEDLTELVTDSSTEMWLDMAKCGLSPVYDSTQGLLVYKLGLGTAIDPNAIIVFKVRFPYPHGP